MRFDFRSATGTVLAALLLLAAWAVPARAQQFQGFDDPGLAPVDDVPGAWGLKIFVLEVGQADAIVVLAANGDVCLVDTGKTNANGEKIARYLTTPGLNGLGRIATADLLITTHYDWDHIGGLKALTERGIRIRKALDQGRAPLRDVTTASGGQSAYGKYCAAVGDPDGDLVQDDDEPDFVRHRIFPGHVETLGAQDQVEVLCVAVRGDTEGTAHDQDLDPESATGEPDENPGSVALLVRLGEFEFYTAGDQTSDDWKSEPDTEAAVVDSGAIPDGADVDVVKVAHHGSDTSSGSAFVQALRPEVAVISTTFTQNRLPKKVALRQFEDVRSFVLITGDGRDDDGNFADSSATADDDSYTPSEDAVFNAQGTVVIRVAADGSRYTVIGESFHRTFRSADSQNTRD